MLEVFELLSRDFLIQTVFSIEKILLKITYDRDIAFSEFCSESEIEWKEFQNNGVLEAFVSPTPGENFGMITWLILFYLLICHKVNL